jgi:hypothetical protein
MDILKLAARYFNVPAKIVDAETEVDVLCVLKCARRNYATQIDQFQVKLSSFNWEGIQMQKSEKTMYFDLSDVFRRNGLECSEMCIYHDRRQAGGFFRWQMENMGFAIELHEHFYANKMPFYELWFCLLELNNRKKGPVLRDLLKLDKLRAFDFPDYFLYHSN